MSLKKKDADLHGELGFNGDGFNRDVSCCEALRAIYNCLLYLRREAVDLGADSLADSLGRAASSANRTMLVRSARRPN